MHGDVWSNCQLTSGTKRYGQHGSTNSVWLSESIQHYLVWLGASQYISQPPEPAGEVILMSCKLAAVGPHPPKTRNFRLNNHENQQEEGEEGRIDMKRCTSSLSHASHLAEPFSAEPSGAA